MSIKMMSAIWDNAPQLEGTKLLILLALADMANDSGVCWPSYATLARRARIQKRRAIGIMQELIEAGFVQKTGRAENGEQKSNLYWINIKAITDGGSAIAMTLPSVPQDTTPSAIAMTLPSAIAIAPEPSINHQIEPPFNRDGRFEIPPVSELDGTIKTMSDRFTSLTGILPFKNDDWVRALRDMFNAGITIKDLENTFAYMRKEKLRISGPWSLVKTAISLRSENNIVNNIDIGSVTV